MNDFTALSDAIAVTLVTLEHMYIIYVKHFRGGGPLRKKILNHLAPVWGVSKCPTRHSGVVQSFDLFRDKKQELHERNASPPRGDACDA